MRLTNSEVLWLQYCCCEEQRYRSTGQRGRRRPVSPYLAQLIRRLELELAASRSGQADDEGLQRLSGEQSWIGTREAATLLGWTTRKVRRHAADLEGQLRSAGWIFSAAVVDEYAEALNDDRDIA